MQPFKILAGIAAPLPMVNVDTDMIIPKQFLKTIERTGLGRHLFDEMRHLDGGGDNPDFVLNRAPWQNAVILIAGANFGCGSSREHAPWALSDFGIRCVIAPSFADIFYNNCFKNGMLPLVLPQESVDALLQLTSAPSTANLTVDLEAQIVTDANGVTYEFSVEAFRKHCLLNGLDDIGLTLQHDSDIAAFEAKQRQSQPWLWSDITL